MCLYRALMQSKLGTQEESRSRTVNLLAHRRANGNYRVLDLGGQPGGWSNSVVDLYVNTGSFDPNIAGDRVLNLDLCDPATWAALDQYVLEHGVFDYCICTHTLEDLVYPFPLLEGMSRWARGGFLSVPSLRSELSNVEAGDYRGFIHHLWLIDAVADQLEFTPKLSMVSSLGSVQFLRHVEELQVEWTERLSYTQVGARGWESPDQVRGWLQGLLGRALEVQR